jgi:hypothetical protein
MKTALLILILAVAALSANARESISISMSVYGKFGEAYAWELAIADDGTSKLTVKGFGLPHQTFPPQTFRISAAKVDQLRELLRQERFFDLRKSYEVSDPDSNTALITARLGFRRKTVELRIFRDDDSHRDEIRRAVRVYTFLRGLLDHRDAVHFLRRYKMILKDPLEDPLSLTSLRRSPP